ncbi:MAG: hypothetical protein WB767_09120, partial [Nocardioides sp.]
HDLGGTFDVVVLAGNIFPLLEPDTLAAVAASLATQVGDQGLVVAGFGLDAEHLPAGVPTVPLSDVDAALADAGLVVADRWSSWDRQDFDDAGYVVGTWRRG